ncbi:MAG: hypothetical protein HYT43_02065 [Candidatus Taylorbacteria bacterium]|nr:hypothetical protein [Candidatus Taylorbacteria bacterium]
MTNTAPKELLEDPDSIGWWFGDQGSFKSGGAKVKHQKGSGAPKVFTFDPDIRFSDHRHQVLQLPTAAKLSFSRHFHYGSVRLDDSGSQFSSALGSKGSNPQRSFVFLDRTFGSGEKVIEIFRSPEVKFTYFQTGERLLENNIEPVPFLTAAAVFNQPLKDFVSIITSNSKGTRFLVEIHYRESTLTMTEEEFQMWLLRYKKETYRVFPQGQ